MELKDFGQYLRELRIKYDYTYEDIAQKISSGGIDAKKIKQWEYDLDFPNLDNIYKLSEIFNIPSAELLAYKQYSLDEGLKSVHVRIIRFISFMLGISIYATIWISRISLFLTLIASFLYFLACAHSVGL